MIIYIFYIVILYIFINIKAMKQLPKWIDKKFRVEGLLGTGLTGDVFLVIEKNARLALKLLRRRPEGLKKKEALSLFKNEFSILRSLNHPGIVKIYDFGCDALLKRFYFTQEYIENPLTLAEASLNKNFSDVLEMFVQVLRALDYLHTCNILHQDLKPENILVTSIEGQKPVIKLIDFGLAGFREKGALAGTPAYLAPELFQHQEYNVQTDIYALGVVFYECLSGNNPFQLDTLVAIIDHHKNFIPPPLSEKKRTLPKYLDAILRRLLEKNPQNRYPTAAKVLGDIQNFAGPAIEIQTKESLKAFLPDIARGVGREKEYQQLKTAIEKLGSGKIPEKKIFIITGPPGIGKSHLLREAIAFAQLADIRVLRHGEEKDEVKEPYLAVLEDGQQFSKRVLLDFVHTHTSKRCLVFLTLDREYLSVRGAERIALAPFSEDELRQYLSHLTGITDLPPSFLAELKKRTGGNPLLIRETLAELIDQGRLFDAHGRWSAATFEDIAIEFSKLQTPLAVEALLQEKVRRLKPAQRKILECLAVLNKPASPELIGKVSQTSEVEKEVLSLSGAFLERDDQWSWAIQNPFIANLILKPMNPDRKEEYHDRIWKCLQETDKNHPAILFHQAQGSDQPIATKAIGKLILNCRAAGDLEEMLIWQQRLLRFVEKTDAAQLTNIKLDIADTRIKLNDSQARQILQEVSEAVAVLQKPQLKVEILERLGLQNLKTNHLLEARTILLQALRLNNTLTKPLVKSLVLENYLGQISLKEGKLEEAGTIFRKTRDAWKVLSSKEKQRVKNNDLAGLYLKEKNWAKALDQLHSDLTFFESIPDPYLIARTHFCIGEACLGKGDEKKAVWHQEQCISISKQLKSYDLLLRAYNSLGNIFLKNRDSKKALFYFERALPVARTIGDLSSQAALCVNLGILYHRQGQKDDAISILSHALNIIDNLPSKTADEEEWEARARRELADMEFQGRAQTNEEENMRSEKLEYVLKINQFLNTDLELNDLLKLILNYALEITGGETGILLLMEEGKEPEAAAVLNVEPDRALVEMSRTIAKKALAQDQCLLIHDAMEEREIKDLKSVAMLKLRSILCAPIKLRGKPIGTLYIDNRTKPHAFKDEDIVIIRSFCDQAGLAIERNQRIQRYQKEAQNLGERLKTISQIMREKTAPLDTKYPYENIAAKSKVMLELLRLLDRIIETNIAVFIHGETGTGKELIARAIHENHPERSRFSFVAINCSAIPVNLMEGELFGYAQGAFTGAVKEKKGLFEEADGGTIFLDEIADLDPGLQAKLLRVLQEKEATRIGETKPRKFNVRIVSASNKDIGALAKENRFREDLFYRLCEITLHIPPLRERKEDLPYLIKKFIEDYKTENKDRTVFKLDPEVLRRFLSYDWPGNVRELENVTRVCLALADNGRITLSSILSSHPMWKGTVVPPKMETRTEVYDETLKWKDYENIFIAKAYAHNNYRPVAAAGMLGISYAKVYQLVKKLDLNDKKNHLYSYPFSFVPDKLLADYQKEIYQKALEHADQRPYRAIKLLGVSQGHFYKVMRSAKKV